jgi:hypothetical protein
VNVAAMNRATLSEAAGYNHAGGAMAVARAVAQSNSALSDEVLRSVLETIKAAHS